MQAKKSPASGRRRRLGDDRVFAWYFQNVLLETYSYAPGQPEDVPRHSHEEYQFGLNLSHDGTYRYRGANHPIPVGSLSVIHPGEVHATCSSRPKTNESHYRMLFVPAALLRRAAADARPAVSPVEPFFREPILLDAELASAFLHLHHSLEPQAPLSLLERECRLASALRNLVARHAETRPAGAAVPQVGASALHRAVELARAYLQAHATDDVSLATLANIAGVSAHHLCRAFHQRIGLPPHRYQIHLRIERAKTLLVARVPVSLVAAETGFYDQSHFGQAFRRFVGVPPGAYAALHEPRKTGAVEPAIFS